MTVAGMDGMENQLAEPRSDCAERRGGCGGSGARGPGAADLRSLGATVDTGDRFFWYSSTGWIMWNSQVSGLLGGTTIAVLYATCAASDAGCQSLSFPLRRPPGVRIASTITASVMGSPAFLVWFF